MSGKEKKDKNARETLEIIKNVFDYNKIASKNFKHTSKVDKRNSEPKTEESIAETVKFKNEKIAEIKKKEKKYSELFMHYFIDYKKPSDICKNYVRQKVKEMKITYSQSKKY